MHHLTVRNIPMELATALEAEKKRRRRSLNQTVIDLLSQSLGVGAGRKRSNGLAKLAGRWSEEEHQRFQEAIAEGLDVGGTTADQVGAGLGQ